MSNDRQDLEQAQALLALRIGLSPDGASDAPPVSDQDLAMLVEDRLPFQRKQQVMKQLLHDDGLMRRWLSVSEAVQGLAEPQAEQSEEKTSALAAWWQQWTAWLFSGATSAAALALGLYIGASAPPEGFGPPDVTSRSPDAQTGAVEVLPASPLPSSCAELDEPVDGTPGHLCVVDWLADDDGRHGLWLWVPEAGSGEQRALAMGPLDLPVLSLTVSEDSAWLMVSQAAPRGAVQMSIYRAADWFAGAGTLPQPVTTVTDPSPSMNTTPRWQDGVLLFESYRDFEDDSLEVETRTWRLDPSAGDGQPKAQ